MSILSPAVPAAMCVVFAMSGLALAQHVVPPQNRYERLVCVVPMTGRGTVADPRRPLYAPLPSELNPASKTAILAYTYVLSDDGNFALVQFAARDQAAFNNILLDKTHKAFVAGRDKKEDLELELKKYKKNFAFSQLELRVQ